MRLIGKRGSALVAIIMAILFGMASSPARADSYPIVCRESAETCEKWAATELSTFLQEIYANDKFPITESAPSKGNYIWLGTPKQLGNLKQHIKSDEIGKRGSFVVRHVQTDKQQVGLICGNDPRGVLDGVYALLEQKLGYGFYLYRNASETVTKSPFDFKKWDLAACPLVDERLCFNWYNFISGVTTWNLPDYKQWIRQAARMQHTDILLHTYGWGPFTQFTHNGVTKSVSHLQNTVHGSFWGVKHTKDIRKLIGGEVFADEGPVFGADVSKVGHGGITKTNRVAKAKAMLREAADYAVNTVGMGFNWSFDVDTTYGQPQNIIKTLPEDARFRVGTHWVAQPDTEAGYLYFKKIIETTMTDFPAITKITLWWRGKAGTNFGGLTLNIKPADLPAGWKPEYDGAPAEAKNALGPGQLYHAKIAQAFRRALDDLGHNDVELGYGSWWRSDNHPGFVAANHFMPSEMTCYALDYHMVFRNSEDYRNALKKTADCRRLVVIEWAHHDDGGYLGRPYTPPVDFATKLQETGALGYGVIHWTTRPLDLFFKSLQNQVWSNTLNEPLEDTCKKMARDFFGESQSEIMGEYLNTWMATAPRFARETNNNLGGAGIKAIGGSVINHEARAKGCEKRIAILDRADTQQFSERALETWKYFRGHEEWIKLFHLAQKTGNIELMEETIRKYVEKASRDGGMTRGEKGILIQHNLKWLKHQQKNGKVDRNVGAEKGKL